MKGKLALSLAAAAAAGAAMIAAPQRAHAQVGIAVGFGTPYDDYGYSWGPPYYRSVDYYSPYYGGFYPGTVAVSGPIYNVPPYAYGYYGPATTAVTGRVVSNRPVYYVPARRTLRTRTVYRTRAYRPRRIVVRRVITAEPRIVTRRVYY